MPNGDEHDDMENANTVTFRQAMGDAVELLQILREEYYDIEGKKQTLDFSAMLISQIVLATTTSTEVPERAMPFMNQLREVANLMGIGEDSEYVEYFMYYENPDEVATTRITEMKSSLNGLVEVSESNDALKIFSEGLRDAMMLWINYITDAANMRDEVERTTASLDDLYDDEEGGGNGCGCGCGHDSCDCCDDGYGCEVNEGDDEHQETPSGDQDNTLESK